MQLTPQMFQALKLQLQGASPYEIARIQKRNPPAVYDSLKAAKRNFWIVKLQLEELELLGFSAKIPPPNTADEEASTQER
ncbi:MAG: hypothetical protein OEX09_09825 [Candidatus Bathyarchaeota archaeon]|nr:hypothetical protein [Candidatus Bathyarchaeota archaeon]